MSIIWSPEARDDVDRLVKFAADFDLDRADEIEHELRDAPKRLTQFPRRGPRVRSFDLREVRSLQLAQYVLWYELAGSDIFILRFFHLREDR